MSMAAAGVAKLVEECGELQQILGKRLQYWHTDDHPDGKGSIRSRIEDEMGDVLAAIEFVIGQLDLNAERVLDRREAKTARFRSWEHEIGDNDQGVDRQTR